MIMTFRHIFWIFFMAEVFTSSFNYLSKFTIVTLKNTQGNHFCDRHKNHYYDVNMIHICSILNNSRVFCLDMLFICGISLSLFLMMGKNSKQNEMTELQFFYYSFVPQTFNKKDITM